MTGTVTWVLMALVGVGTMWLMRKTHSRLDPIMERFAAAAFLGAGAIGATGWVGELMRGLTGWLLSLGDEAGRSLFGVAVVWILAAGLGIAWVGAFLPGKVFNWRYPDWLMVAGFFLPPLLTGVPGVLGDLLRSGTETVGNTAVSLVGTLIGA